MLNKNVLDEIGGKINEILSNSPARDVEKNMRTMLSGIFTRLDLVTREEFEVQQEVIKRARIKLGELEDRINHLENLLRQQQTSTEKETTSQLPE
ncbi:MAG: accessory factor UbiK family protein [Nitrosomonas sp.]|nr:accessory factor UbiK family protein [Nitrosomonas sp.]